MSDLLYKKFVKRWEEVTDIPPQKLGPFTPMYKTLVKRLKVMPWPMLIIAAILVVAFVYGVIGTTITAIASLLQKGF